MSNTALTTDEINAALANLPSWTFTDDSLQKTFTFKNFRESISFLVRVGFSAEELNHHPEIFNVYNRVSLTLRTHDAGDKVTERDVQLAQAIERFAWV